MWRPIISQICFQLSTWPMKLARVSGERQLQRWSDTDTEHASPAHSSSTQSIRQHSASAAISSTLKPRHVHALSQNSTKLSQSFHLQRRVHDDFVSIMPPLLSVAALFLIQPQTHQTALPQKQLSLKMRSAARSSLRPKAVGAHSACFTLPTVPRTAQNSSPS